ncbi:hypothetical protein HDU84_004868 [Entophlyctis sp. JEL0112]|nr:hypothetical protein HDU84_004868 [Entophlyctis sp. JEL0112]
MTNRGPEAKTNPGVAYLPSARTDRDRFVPQSRGLSTRDLPAAVAARNLAATIKRGIVAHAHITPCFSRPIPLSWNCDLKHDTIELTEHMSPGRDCEPQVAIHTTRSSDVLPKDSNTKAQSSADKAVVCVPSEWIKDFSCRMKSRKSGQKDDFPLRITIHSIEENAASNYPRCHRITLKSPFHDAFFHWTFLCHRFNFRTMARNLGWNIPDENSFIRAFESFGDMVRDRVRECLQNPQSFQAEIEVFDPDDLLVLTFYEFVSGYRKVTLLSLEFVPSPWSEVVADVRSDYERTRAHYSNIHNALVQSLNIVSKLQPALLLSGGVPDLLKPDQVTSWKELVRDLLEENGKHITAEEKIMRKKMFVLLTSVSGDTLEEISSKSMKLKIKGFGGGNDLQTSRITFNFLATPRDGNSNNSSFFIKITSLDDLFLSFTSQEITREVFHAITTRIQLSIDMSELHRKLNISKNGSTVDSKREERLKGERMRIFGFLPNEGIAGGVVGVIANDLLKNVEDNPARYGVILKVRNLPNPDKPQHSSSAENETAMQQEASFCHKSGRDWTIVDVHSGRITTTCGVQAPTAAELESTRRKVDSRIQQLHALTARNPPDLRKAKLVFTETVMNKTREILSIDFTETARENLQKEVRERYRRMKVEIDWVQHRLDTLFDTVRRKNPKLMATLGAIPIPCSVFGKPTVASAIRNAFRSATKTPIVQPETSSKEDEKWQQQQAGQLVKRIRGVSKPVIVSTANILPQNEFGGDIMPFHNSKPTSRIPVAKPQKLRARARINRSRRNSISPVRKSPETRASRATSVTVAVNYLTENSDSATDIFENYVRSEISSTKKAVLDASELENVKPPAVATPVSRKTGLSAAAKVDSVRPWPQAQ